MTGVAWGCGVEARGGGGGGERHAPRAMVLASSSFADGQSFVLAASGAAAEALWDAQPAAAAYAHADGEAAGRAKQARDAGARSERGGGASEASPRSERVVGPEASAASVSEVVREMNFSRLGPLACRTWRGELMASALGLLA